MSFLCTTITLGTAHRAGPDILCPIRSGALPAPDDRRTPCRQERVAIDRAPRHGRGWWCGEMGGG
ncbi:hypothetical protein GCM10017778_33710 [Streptomyces vinaceus]|nr:hypothetical protein GCM10017778_33710 [Streptomyces vinaceus]